MTRGGIALWLAAALLAGCPEDRGAGPDAGADLLVPDGSAHLDHQVLADLGVIKACEVQCTKQALHLCVSDPADAKKGCVECLDDSHCLGNPGALGPRCDKTLKFCTCASDADCKSNLRGKRCSLAEQMCTCQGDAHCSAVFPICAGGGGTSSVCIRPCVSDGDCPWASAPRCDVKSGLCVACLKDADCTAHPNGTQCKAGACACSGAQHCQGAAYPWGAVCGVTVSGGSRCGCTTAQDCSGNPHGPACDAASRRCTCSGDSQCTASGYSKCSPAYPGAAYSHCQVPCSSDQQCKDQVGLAKCQANKCVDCVTDVQCGASTPRCDTSRGRCVGCLKDEHCTSSSAPFCDAASAACRQCKADSDCAASLEGSLCSGGTCGCSADTHCSGPHTWGTACNLALGRCACTGASQCKGVSAGPTCDGTFHKCTCAKDSDCTSSKYSLCALPYLQAGYSHCQAPCAADKDCAGISGMPRCDSTTGHCLPCLSDKDCAAKTHAKVCDSKLGCVECTSAAPCTASSLGSKCDIENGVCYCSADADCAASAGGKVCNAGLKVCGCAKDTDCPAGKTCKGSYLAIKVCA